MTWVIVTKEEFECQFRDLTRKDKPLAKRLAKTILKLEDDSHKGKTSFLRPLGIEVPESGEIPDYL